MTWQPTDAQTLARMDPDVNPRQEAEARARAAHALIGHWLDGPRDAVLLDAASDMLQIGLWWTQE